MIDTDISLPVSTARSKLKKLAEIMNLNDSYLCKNRSEANALATSIRRCKFNKARKRHSDKWRKCTGINFRSKVFMLIPLV
jgi:hypothetical protein